MKIRRRPTGRVLAALAALLGSALLPTGAGASTDRAQAAPAPVSPPSISGTPRQGALLRDAPGRWSGGPVTSAFQWRVCDATGSACSDVPRATDSVYAVRPADAAHTLRLLITARNAAGAASAVAAPTAAIAAAPASVPLSTVRPSVAGRPVEGGQVAAQPGTWSGSRVRFTYDWRRCDPSGGACKDIGRHDRTYRPRDEDVGRALRVLVTATSEQGVSVALSDPTHPVVPAPTAPVVAPRNKVAPTVAGTTEVGRALAGSHGQWSPAPTSFEYSWLRCDRSGGDCGAIGGATGTTYRLTRPDFGTTLRFRVTAKADDGETAATSVPTAVIAAAPQPPAPPRPNGCPPGGNPVDAARIGPPARLLVDALTTSPRVVTRSTRTLVVRFHVTSTCGGPVRGALVYATATPYNQFSIPPEAVTGSDGWAELRFRRLSGFPVSRRQQLIAMFVRARKPGDSLLGGISTRRLVSIRVELGR